MRKFLFIFLIILVSVSCKSTKKVHSKQHTNTRTKQQQHKKRRAKKDTKTSYTISDKIIQNANYYKGTKYQFGGTTKKGMDCSGLIYIAYKKEHILLPRVSRDMANQGKTIALRQVQKGDLLFFKTGKRNRINHVGMVTKIVNNEVFFIHASSSNGVIISSMHSNYYKKTFVKAKRVLE